MVHMARMARIELLPRSSSSSSMYEGMKVCMYEVCMYEVCMYEAYMCVCVCV